MRAIRVLLSDETLDNTPVRSLESHLESFIKQPLPECFVYSYKRFAGRSFVPPPFWVVLRYTVFPAALPWLIQIRRKTSGRNMQSSIRVLIM